ncbi:MAG: hypothetical protein IJJ65_04515 [Butyrivibrio sp.]|nr:hypothetical protein [Butyrivibrio sp.]
MMRGTRHNGRSGSHGVYNPKHNDREFDHDKAVDINSEMTPNNIYWNCFQGFTFHKDRGADWMPFKDVELLYYKKEFSDWLDAQNERHIKGGHRDRVKTMEKIIENKRWCPEETIYQIGNINGTIDYNDLAMIVAETMQKIDERFGEYVCTLDWGLHVDEATPHIHERHVFFAPDEYGFRMPQQEEACRKMGLKLPCSEKERGRFNNRKMTFDSICRDIFLETCKAHGLEMEVEPIYGGKKYQEKTEFINGQINMKNQKLTIENGELLFENSSLIDRRMNLTNEIGVLDEEKTRKEIELADVETFISDVTEIAYDKACEIIIDEIAEDMRKESAKEISKMKTEIIESTDLKTKLVGGLVLDQLTALLKRLFEAKNRVVSSIKRSFSSTAKKEQLLRKIADEARPSLLEVLNKRKEAIALGDKERALEVPSRKKKYEHSL